MNPRSARAGTAASIAGIIATIIASEITDFDRGTVTGLAIAGALMAFVFAWHAFRARE